MKVLAFYGGARKKGNTKYMLNLLLEHLNYEFEIIDSYNYETNPCTDCRRCLKLPGCSIDDQITNSLYEKVQKADIIIFASPIYFFSISGKLKTIVDRFQTYWGANQRNKNNDLKKIGIILQTGGAPYFKNQFIGGEIVLKSVLNEMNANILDIINVSNTDVINVENNLEIKNKIKKLAKKIKNEN